MDTLDRFNAALSYIESNLDGAIDGKEISKITLYSAYRFQKIFAAMSGISLSEYIRNRRLDRAAFDLRNTDETVMDIALKYGYDSPTAFNRAFQRLHGVAPSKVRTEKDLQLKAYPPMQIQLCIKGATVMKYRIVEQKAFSLVGYKLPTMRMKNFEQFKEIPKFWNEHFSNGNFAKLMSINLSEKHDNGRVDGVLGICVVPDIDSEALNYYIATAYEKEVPDGMETVTVPDCTYAVFECKGKIPFSVQDMTRRLYGEWLPNSGYEWANAPDIERYFDGDPTSEDYVCELWLPVRAKKRGKINVSLEIKGDSR